MTEAKEISIERVCYLESLNNNAFSEAKEIRIKFLKNWLKKIKDRFISFIN